jgi:hypothetical protein
MTGRCQVINCLLVAWIEYAERSPGFIAGYIAGTRHLPRT